MLKREGGGSAPPIQASSPGASDGRARRSVRRPPDHLPGRIAMYGSRVVWAGIVALIISGCTAGHDGGIPTAPSASRSPVASASPNAAHPVQTSGTFDAIVDFPTITLTPKGSNCLLQVQGHLIFHGM